MTQVSVQAATRPAAGRAPRPSGIAHRFGAVAERRLGAVYDHVYWAGRGAQARPDLCSPRMREVVDCLDRRVLLRDDAQPPKEFAVTASQPTDQPVGFAAQIRPLFWDMDRLSMRDVST